MYGVSSRSSAAVNVMVMAVQKAAKSLVRDFCELEKLQVSAKGFGNFVTTADARSEEILIRELSKARPDYEILSEERGEVEAVSPRLKVDPLGGYRWIIDPLDGTANFWHGIPHFAVSVALEHKGDVLAGVVCNPITDELFYGEKGKGVFLNNQRIRVSGRRNLAAALVGLGSPTGHQGRPLNRPGIAKIGALRHLGACSLDLAFVASGRLDAFFEADVPLWSRAAGAVLVREAGGLTGTWCGDSSLLASNSFMYPAFAQILVV